MGFKYEQIDHPIGPPEKLKRNRWILKTVGLTVIAFWLAVAGYSFAQRFVNLNRVQVQGQFLTYENKRLFLIGECVKGTPFPLDQVDQDILPFAENKRHRPYPIASNEYAAFLEHSEFVFELECQRLRSIGGNFLNWELQLPFDPDFDLTPIHAKGVRKLLDVAKKNGIFVVLSLIESSTLKAYAETGLYDDVDRYVSRVLVPLFEELKGHVALLAYSPLDRADQLLDFDNDLDGFCTNVDVLKDNTNYQKTSHGLNFRVVQYLMARVAEMVHTIDPEELVTVTSSILTAVKPVGLPGFFSDYCLEMACDICDSSKAVVDFYMPASFGISSRGLMPSVPFMASFDKPIILAFNPSDEIDLQPDEKFALPKTLLDIGFSGFFLPSLPKIISLADDIRVNGEVVANEEYSEVVDSEGISQDGQLQDYVDDNGETQVAGYEKTANADKRDFELMNGNTKMLIHAVARDDVDYVDELPPIIINRENESMMGDTVAVVSEEEASPQEQDNKENTKALLDPAEPVDPNLETKGEVAEYQDVITEQVEERSLDDSSKKDQETANTEFDTKVEARILGEIEDMDNEAELQASRRLLPQSIISNILQEFGLKAEFIYEDDHLHSLDITPITNDEEDQELDELWREMQAKGFDAVVNEILKSEEIKKNELKSEGLPVPVLEDVQSLLIDLKPKPLSEGLQADAEDLSVGTGTEKRSAENVEIPIMVEREQEVESVIANKPTILNTDDFKLNNRVAAIETKELQEIFNNDESEKGTDESSDESQGASVDITEFLESTAAEAEKLSAAVDKVVDELRKLVDTTSFDEEFDVNLVLKYHKGFK